MDDPHRSIHVMITGPTPRSALAAARIREAWRAFWRRRGEESDAVAAWADRHAFSFGCLAGLAGIAVLVGFFVWMDGAEARECSAACAKFRIADSFRHDDGDCYCIDDARSVPLDDLLAGREPAPASLLLRSCHRDESPDCAVPMTNTDGSVTCFGSEVAL